MNAALGSIQVHQHDHTVTFRVQGRVTMPHSVPLRKYGERALAGEATSLHVDLRGCAYMDSTFLGTLLTLRNAVARKGQGDFLVISPSEGCAKLLHQMGLTGLLLTREEAVDPDATWSEL